MDSKTNKLLQQAGKYVLLGKLSLALEEYLKIYELDSEDTTIMNMIADLYSRMEVREEALQWYHRLAETFEFLVRRQQPGSSYPRSRRRPSGRLCLLRCGWNRLGDASHGRRRQAGRR